MFLHPESRGGGFFLLALHDGGGIDHLTAHLRRGAVHPDNTDAGNGRPDLHHARLVGQMKRTVDARQGQGMAHGDQLPVVLGGLDSRRLRHPIQNRHGRAAFAIKSAR